MTPRLAPFLVAALVAAGCGGSGGDRGHSSTGDAVELAPPGSADGAGSGSGDGSGAGGSGGARETPGGAGAEGSGGGGTGPGGGGAGTGSPSPPSEPAPDDDAAVGSLAAVLLDGSVDAAVVEIDHTPGQGLAARSRDALARQLSDRGGKRVTFASGEAVPGQAVWTTTDLRRLVADHRDVRSSRDRPAVYVLALGGRHEREGLLGVAFAATAFAVFPEEIPTTLLTPRAVYEEAVVVHELGHVFGLVNLTGHGAFHLDPDAAHGCHSASNDSVMYWAIERSLIADLFEGGPPHDFDADDAEEMRRIRSGSAPGEPCRRG